MAFTVTDLGSARWRGVLVVLVILGVLVFLSVRPRTGNHGKAPVPADMEALRRSSCVFLRHGDSRVLGGGVFLGIEEGDTRRVFCLTARHVMTGWDGDGNARRAHYLHPRGLRIMVTGADGIHEWKASIAPDRWFSADCAHDLAWFELTGEELESLGGIGVVPVGATMEEGIGMKGGKLMNGVTAIRRREYAKAGVTSGSDMMMFRPVRAVGFDGADTPVGTGATTNVCFAMGCPQLKIVTVDFECHHTLRNTEMELLVVELRTTYGDSGSPVFAMGVVGMTRYPLLLGVTASGTKVADGCSKFFTAIIPLEEALLLLGKERSGHRLVEFPEYR